VWTVLAHAVFKPLERLRDTIKRQEREAFFGKLAAGLVHDLRHPIQSLEHCGRNLDKAATDPVLRATLERNFEREFEKINAFLKDLEDLSSGIPHLPIRLNLKTLLEETVASFAEDARESDVRFETDCQPIEVNGDRLALTRLFSNLVSNAIQAMKSGGILRIDTATAKDRAIVHVKDSGKGIPAEQLDRIFDEFWTSKARGLGLGLAIAKKIIAQHGGTIEVESTPGKGSCFTVYLPIQ
jgi:two-component system sensor histidine kinase HydH